MNYTGIEFQDPPACIHVHMHENLGTRIRHHHNIAEKGASTSCRTIYNHLKFSLAFAFSFLSGIHDSDNIVLGFLFLVRICIL